METVRVLSNQELGAAIRLRRRELELSQDELAHRLNVSYQQVQRYETGKNILNVETLQLLAQALCVPIAYFFPRASDSEATAYTAVCGTGDESELLALYRGLKSREKKTLILGLARLAAEEAGGNEDVDQHRGAEPLQLKTRMLRETDGDGRYDNRLLVSVCPR